MTKKFYNKAKIMCGTDALDMISYELIKNICTRVMVLYDSKVNYKVITRIKEILAVANVNATFISVKDKPVATISRVKFALTQFVDTVSEVMICVGGESVINIGKAVKALVSTGKTEVADLKELNVLDKMQLMLVPTRMSGISVATANAMVYDKYNNIVYQLDGDVVNPNCVIVDKRTISKPKKHYDFVIAKLLPLGMALVVLSDKYTPIYAKTFALSALDFFKGHISDNFIGYDMPAEDLFMAQLYAGNAYHCVRDGFLDSMVLHTAMKTGREYEEAFAPIFARYLIYYKETLNKSIIDELGEMLGVEKYIKIPKENREEYVASAIEKSLQMLKTGNSAFSLSALGVNVDIINQVTQLVLEDMNAVGNHEKEMMIQKVLYDAL